MLPIGEVASLGMIVSTEEGRVKLEEMSTDLKAFGISILITITV